MAPTAPRLLFSCEEQKFLVQPLERIDDTLSLMSLVLFLSPTLTDTYHMNKANGQKGLDELNFHPPLVLCKRSLTLAKGNDSSWS